MNILKRSNHAAGFALNIWCDKHPKLPQSLHRCGRVVRRSIVRRVLLDVKEDVHVVFSPLHSSGLSLGRGVQAKNLT